MFFCEEGFAYGVKHMNKPRTMCTFFSIVFWNCYPLRSVPYEWSAACAIDMFIQLSKSIFGVGISEFGGFVC